MDATILIVFVFPFAGLVAAWLYVLYVLMNASIEMDEG